jgi:hypothetical protein
LGKLSTALEAQWRRHGWLLLLSGCVVGWIEGRIIAIERRYLEGLL